MKKTNENDYVKENPWGILIFLLLLSSFSSNFPLAIIHSSSMPNPIFFFREIQIYLFRKRRILWLISSLSWFLVSLLVFHSFHRNMLSGSAAEAVRKGLDLIEISTQKSSQFREFHCWGEYKIRKKKINLMKDSFSSFLQQLSDILRADFELFFSPFSSMFHVTYRRRCWMMERRQPRHDNQNV